LWLAIAGISLSLLLISPDTISQESISQFLGSLGTMALLVYIGLSLARSLLMIPSTPIILAGAVSFPEQLLIVFLISLVGIVVGGILVYSFPSFGDYGSYLESKYPDKIRFLKEKMHGPYSFWIVMGWSIFPLVPTDVICYVAGLVKMNFKKMLTALVIGELPLIVLYIYLGTEVGEWLRI